MTWASIVKKQADPQIDVPKQVLIVDPKSSDQKAVIKSEEQWRRILPEELPDGAKIVVLDTGAFLRAPCIQELGDLFYTTQDVLNEIRDVQHREALQNIMAEVVVCSPNDEAIRTVLKLTTETGDIGALSRTDLRILAVAYQLAKEANVLRTVKEITDEQREYADEEDDEEEEDIGSEGSEEQQYPKNNAQDSPCESQDAGEIAEIAETSTENAADDMDHEDEDEDSSDWITPENIHVHQAASGHEKIVKLCNSRTEQAVVSCLTVDFSMQNALLHLGIPVLSIDGRAITRVRTWIFRCHACFTLVQDTSRQFCPACGSGNTLRKVSYTVDAQGNRNVWINWRKRLNTRGIRYNLPKPRWGAHGTNRTLVLREDQLRDFKKTKSQRQILQEREKQLKDTDGLFSKKKNYGSHALRERSSYARYNINERRQIRAARKK